MTVLLSNEWNLLFIIQSQDDFSLEEILTLGKIGITRMIKLLQTESLPEPFALIGTQHEVQRKLLYTIVSNELCNIESNSSRRSFLK